MTDKAIPPMARQTSPRVHNALLDAIARCVGEKPLIQFFGGVPKAAITDPPGELLAQFRLPRKWCGHGQKRLLMTCYDPIQSIGVANGTPTHFRLCASNGIAHLQSDYAPGLLDQAAVVLGKPITIRTLVSGMGGTHSLKSLDCQLDAIIAAIGPDAILRTHGGVMPADISQPASPIISELRLPTQWMHAAAGGRVRKKGVWECRSSQGGGLETYLRFHRQDGEACVQMPHTSAPLGVLGAPVQRGMTNEITEFEFRL